MKDGIYYTRANGGTTYFVLNDKILMRLLGETYIVTKHFVFGEYKSPLQDMMIEKFDEAYDNAKHW
mgnify:CR=1 FL=1|jgi:hypothetical protein